MRGLRDLGVGEGLTGDAGFAGRWLKGLANVKGRASGRSGDGT